MIAILLAFAACDIGQDVKALFTGNWTVEVAHITAPQEDEEVDPEIFYLRFKPGQEKTDLTADIYTTSESEESLISFGAHFTGKGSFTLKIGEEECEINFAETMAPHVSATGHLNDGSIYNIVLHSSSRAQISIFDAKSKEWTVYYIIKDIDRTPQSFIKKYGSMALMLVFMVGSQIFSYKMSNKYSKAPATAAPAAAPAPQEEKKEETTEEKVTEVTEEKNDEAKEGDSTDATQPNDDDSSKPKED